jgi:TatD DNase family protein
VTGCERIRTALGLHPQLAHQRVHELELFDALLPQARYVGEIGLDGGKGFKEHWAIQLKVFRHILKSVGNAGGRIMTIHSRASASAVLEELRGVPAIPIMHWFTGTKSEMKTALDIGCWFSVGPAMLKTKRGLELISLMPKDRIVTETDGPFAKYEGKALMPWDVEYAFLGLSNIWGLTVLEAKQQVSINLKTLTSRM